MKAGSKGPFRCSSCYVNLYLFLICLSFPFSVHSFNVLWIKFIVPICIIKYVCCCVCFLFIKLQMCHQIASIAIVWNNKNYGAFSGIIINRYGCIILFIFYYFHRTTGYTSSTLCTDNKIHYVLKTVLLHEVRKNFLYRVYSSSRLLCYLC
jgi:hypothetical protein